MRNLLVILIPVVFFISCSKEDPPMQYEIPEETIYFKGKINDNLRDYINKVNGFETSITCKCLFQNADTFLLTTSSSGMYQASEGFYIGCREKLFVNIMLKYDARWNLDSAFHKKLEVATLPYFYQPKDSLNPSDSVYIPNMSDCVEVIFYDINGEKWTSKRGKQDGYTFKLVKSTPIEGYITAKRRIKMEFECKLYNDKGTKSLELTSGEALFDFIRKCN